MEDIVLTPEQEKQILDFWNRDPANPPGIKELTKAIFPEGNFDGRSAQGRSIKQTLSKLNLRARATSDYSSKTAIIQLTDEQKAFVTNNVSTMNALEITKMIFKNPELTNLNAETRVVNDFIKTLSTTVIYNQQANEEIPEGQYVPPNTFDKALKVVNKYVNFVLDKDKLTSNQKKGIEALINYLHIYRFIRQMNSFDKAEDRNSCEDAFVRYTYDKPDLTQEEIDQYIELANSTVQGIKTYNRKNLLEDRLAGQTGGDSDTEERMKVSMGLVEAIGKAATEYESCMKRQNKLLDDLKEKRSTRLSKQVRDNATINNLVQDWRNEEYRVKMIHLGEMERKTLEKELDRLMTMEDVKCRIMGINLEDIVPNG
jgi:hypothetical protein